MSKTTSIDTIIAVLVQVAITLALFLADAIATYISAPPEDPKIFWLKQAGLALGILASLLRARFQPTPTEKSQ